METAESRLSKTLFIVEATSFEQHSIWEKNRDGRFASHFEWQHIPDGWLVEVGEINSKPCCISVSWAKIEGYLVMFYHPTSRMVDWQMIEAWISESFQGKWDSGTRKAKTDAQNFHHCVDAINERKQLDGAK